MKTLLYLAVILFPLVSRAQLLSFDVHEVKSSKKTTYRYRNDWGDAIKDVNQSKTIEVSLTSSADIPVKVEAFWSNAQSQAATVGRMVTQKFTFSNSASQSVVDFYMSNYYRTSGAPLSDWLVVIRGADGTPIAHKAQTQEGEARFAKMEELRKNNAATAGAGTPDGSQPVTSTGAPAYTGRSIPTQSTSPFTSGSQLQGSALDRKPSR